VIDPGSPKWILLRGGDTTIAATWASGGFLPSSWASRAAILACASSSSPCTLEKSRDLPPHLLGCWGDLLQLHLEQHWSDFLHKDIVSHPVLEGKPNANHVRARISNSRTQSYITWTSSHTAQIVLKKGIIVDYIISLRHPHSLYNKSKCGKET
jgi:hypothetical protein